MNSDIETLIKSSVSQLGLQLPAQDEFGAYSIQLEDGFYLSIMSSQDPDYVYLATPISILDHLDNKALYRRALEANFMLIDTRGATLAIDSIANQLLICSSTRADHLDEETLSNEIRSIVSAAQELRISLLNNLDNKMEDTSIEGSSPFFQV